MTGGLTSVGKAHTNEAGSAGNEDLHKFVSTFLGKVIMRLA
jgi:hypothetical protein